MLTSPPVGLALYPWSNGTGSCYPGGAYPNGAATDAVISVTAHEILETVTDPFGNGWFHLNTGGEIGDLCAWNFGTRAGDGSNVTMNGRKYLIQREWSNVLNGCALSMFSGSDVNAPDAQTTLEPIDHATGPSVTSPDPAMGGLVPVRR